MTADYGVHIRNTFDLLDEDAPPKQSKPKETKEEPKKEVKRTSDRARPNPRVEGGDRRVDGGDRGRGGARGGRGGRGRGGGGGGGGGGGEGGHRERREFDGHLSRSGKTREPKKEGAGKFNEGSAREVIADGTAEDRRRHPRRSETEGTPAESKDQPEGAADAADGAAVDAPEEKTGKDAIQVELEEPATQTYDEFLASKKKLDADLAIQRREAQNDESQFKAVKIIAKSEEKNPYIIASAAAEEKEKPAKAKKDKAKHISLDEFTASASNSANRGGYRGRGGRGRGRGGDSGALLYNDSNFPGLAAGPAPKEKK